jgi:hypothetical protein
MLELFDDDAEESVEPVEPNSAERPELLESEELPENNWPIVLATLASMICTSCSAWACVNLPVEL